MVSMNGGFGGETELLNPKAWKRAWKRNTLPYWYSYKISVAGSKIGDAVNFNLPPVKTCANGVPCTREGCYAIKAYSAYPSAKAAMECNLALLRQDSGFEFLIESMKRALRTRRKDGERKFSLCRFHVNGDLGIKEGDTASGVAYLGAICEIARTCTHVRFWMYTKQYEILSKYKGSIPPNLCIIVSCWGEFNPFQVTKDQFKTGDLKSGLDGSGKNVAENEEGEIPELEMPPVDETYAELADRFPLAYLDDGSKIGEMINMKIQKKVGLNDKPPKICPCTDYTEIITRCETCKLCWDGSLKGTNLAFRKH